MEKNVGGLDRKGRVVLGVLLAIAGIAAVSGYWAIGSVVGVIVLVVSAIAFVTASTQKCPTNHMLGIDTTR